MAQNLLRYWVKRSTVEVWGINYFGWPHKLPYTIYPATNSDKAGDFQSAERLSALGERINNGKYDVVWFINDLACFSRHRFPDVLRQICDQNGTKTVFYFPADSAFEESWLDILRAVDVPVAYTEQGKAQLPEDLRARCLVLPHGVDPAVYYPRPERQKLRAELFSNDWVQPGDLLLLNVNRNQKRKDPSRSLQLLKLLQEAGVPAKLVMHMPRTSQDGVDLETVARQFGLMVGEDWLHTTKLFHLNHPLKGEDMLNALFNVADLLVTTTFGEGWGLSITEAAAAGCPVAIPKHSACAEIGDKLLGFGDRVLFLPVDPNATVLPYDNSRVRYGVDVREAALCIADAWFEGALQESARRPLTEGAREWLGWKRIAGKWLDVFNAPKPKPEVKVAPKVSPTSLTPAEFSFRPGTCDKNVFVNVVERNEYRLPDRFDPADVIIDIGCHIGSFTWACLKRGARNIWAFEAEPGNYQIARRHLAGPIEAGFVKLLHAAVWRSEWDLGERLPILYHGGYTKMGSEINTGGGGVLGGETGMPVCAVGLDDVLAKVGPVRLLKLDCEGSEWPILYTARCLLEVAEICGEFHEIATAPPSFGQAMDCSILALRLFLEQKFDFQTTHFRHGPSSLGLFFCTRPARARWGEASGEPAREYARPTDRLSTSSARGDACPTQATDQTARGDACPTAPAIGSGEGVAA